MASLKFIASQARSIHQYKNLAKYNLIVIIASCLEVCCVLTVHNILYKSAALTLVSRKNPSRNYSCFVMEYSFSGLVPFSVMSLELGQYLLFRSQFVMGKYSCENKHIAVSGLLSLWEHDCWRQFCFIKLLYKAHRTMDRTGTGDWNENKWIMRSRVSCFILPLFVIFQEFKLNYVIYVQMKTEQTFIFVFCVNPSSRSVTRIYCIYSLQFQLLAFCETIQ